MYQKTFLTSQITSNFNLKEQVLVQIFKTNLQ